ncbi:MAG: hypothetical protein U0531_03840 [Dehalococcoidia bacterium]
MVVISNDGGHPACRQGGDKAGGVGRTGEAPRAGAVLEGRREYGRRVGAGDEDHTGAGTHVTVRGHPYWS